MAEEIAEETTLPEGMVRVLGEYERHLVSERDLAAHTVRAYMADVSGMLEHARRLGHDDVTTLDLRALRSWLARLQTTGKSRATMARRATAARVFTAWLARTGRSAHDPGASLGSPKAHKFLPPILRADEARDLIQAAAAIADDGSPIGLRDVAMLELLYASGIRVGELVGLDVDDVDRDRNVVRVFGKGRKERSVPFGGPAARAIDRYLAGGRPQLRVDAAGAALFLGSRGRRIDQRCGAHPGAPADRGSAWRSGYRATRAPAYRGHAPSRGWGRPSVGPGAAGPQFAGDDAALHTRHDRSATEGLSTGPPPRVAKTRPVRVETQ